MSPVQTPPEHGTYLYCLAWTASLPDAKALKGTGLGAGGSLRFIAHEDISAVVGDAPPGEIQASRRNIRAHEEVVEEVLQHSDVLPVRFGLVASDDQEIRDQLLARQYRSLSTQLERVRGRVELVLKASWDEGQLFDELRRANPDLAAQSRAEGMSLDDKIEIGRRVEEAIATLREEESERLVDELRPLASDLEMLPHTSELMFLNAAFLVDRKKVEEFDKQVERLAERQPGRLTLKYVGPLPPYDFVSLEVAEEVEQHAQ
jgi:hypothetical protein